jgi:hypothetical protein
LRSDDFDARRETKFAEKVLAILPSEAECANISNSKTGDDGGKRPGIALGQLAQLCFQLFKRSRQPHPPRFPFFFETAQAGADDFAGALIKAAVHFLLDQ